MKLSKQKAMEGAGVVVKDPRFARLHSDPRFQRAFKRKLKIPIDSRFRHIFSDERFSDPLALDKRGRNLRDSKTRHSKKRHALHQYYHLDDDGGNAVGEDNEEIALQGNGTHENSATGSSLSGKDRFSDGKGTLFGSREAGSVRNKSKKGQPMASHGDEGMKVQEEARDDPKSTSPPRVDTPTDFQHSKEGNLELEENSSEEDSDSEEDSEASSETSSSSSGDSSDEEVMGAQDNEVEDEKVPVTERETRRLALVNMDWDHIRAVDILAVMNSFLPKGGQILSVYVFPSEFGLQQLKEEEQRGPQGLFQSESSDDDQEGKDGVNMEKLRQYEKDKLRYYYAVVECDSAATADFLYKSCDGMEFERTSNTLDLRFIPDIMEFTNSARDVAREVPPDYQAPMFETRALQHSRVKLTWDDDEPDRVKTLHQKFDADKLNDMDFKAYLASDTEEDEDAVEDLENKEPEDKAKGDDDMDLNGASEGKKGLRDKYRALLSGAEDAFGCKDLNNNKDKDMEITFNSGLEELSKRLMDKNKQKVGDETVWEAYLRKKKEKKKLQKLSMEQREEESTEEEQAGDGVHDGDFDDPFFKSEDDMGFAAMERSESEREEELPVAPVAKHKKGARAQKKAELEEKKREEERSRAELELLFADELAAGSGVKGYNLKKKFKGKRKEMEKLPDKLPTVNYDDPRFAALFTSHRFAIDPTEPEYKRSATQLRSLLDKQQKHWPQVHEVVAAKAEEDTMSGVSKKEKQELFSIVKSLKRKVGAVAEM